MCYGDSQPMGKMRPEVLARCGGRPPLLSLPLPDCCVYIYMYVHVYTLAICVSSASFVNLQSNLH